MVPSVPLFPGYRGEFNVGFFEDVEDDPNQQPDLPIYRDVQKIPAGNFLAYIIIT